ncbi:hypothetical protein M9Y10_035871 [Tritrichomonas musculus]|uniref:Uncharacterized protein n=1 Tax=Tritrichomonas musculus TaxID=1915356 RepID=A0ABR2GVG5_9EUKA
MNINPKESQDLEMEQFNTIQKNNLPNSVKKLQIMLFSIIIVLILLTFAIFLTKNSKKITNLSVLNIFSKQYQRPQDFTIMIHTSNRTKWRLDKYLNQYIIKKPHIHIFVIYSEQVTPDPRFDYIIANDCVDKRSDLHCRNSIAYNYFLQNEILGDFLYRAMDDTLLNITNLEKLIDQLRMIYNPKEHLVFRAFANDESPYGKIYLGGGSGWLMSRAMVAIHNIASFSFEANIKYAFAGQDDTCETLILNKVGFKSVNVWEDLHWAENGCTFGNFSEYLNGNFKQLEDCPIGKKELISLPEMIAMHGIDEEQKDKWILSRNFPDYIYGYKVTNNQCVRMCKSVPGMGTNRTSFQYLKKNAEFITLSDILKKNISDFNNNLNYITR